jgi:gliding motility-associated protein GldM
MAGGKLTPRQKMINLMYLVFIAMLALNMSKEVLSAFGLMNEKFENSNVASIENNQNLLDQIDKKGAENAGEFGQAKATADKISEISKSFYDYIGTLKPDATDGVVLENGKLPYEAMEKGTKIDETWFAGDGYSAKGTAIVAAMNKYVADIKAATAGQSKLDPMVKEIESKFNTNDVKDREGVVKKYLSYHFEHFPSIASLAKLSAWQSDVKKAEFDIYSTLLGKAAQDAASYTKFKGIVVLDRNVYFQGDKVTGKVVLGKFDPNTKPTSFQGPGRIENGQAIISETAGSIGERGIKGQFTFMENGKAVPVPFEGSYVVVARPNSATISADKMTVSFAGVPDNNVSASAAGLSRSGKGYVMRPGSGTEVTINVTGKLSDGKSVSDRKVFRIKNIPAPQGAIGGATGLVKGQKTRLGVSTISAVLPDFDFDVNLSVVQFSFKVTGMPTVVVSGNRINAACNAALARATRGDQVTISEIKTKLAGSDLMLRQTAPVIYEIQ